VDCQAMVGVLRDAGVEVRDQPVLPSALGLPDGARTRLLVVDHDGLFRVYCAENLPSSLPISGIKGALKKSGDVALLLVNRGEGEFVALLAAVDGEIHQEDLDEDQVARLLPNVRAVEGEDPYEVSERVKELILHPEEERRAYQNKGLFSDDYLEYRLTDPGQYPEWGEDVSRARERLRGLYESKKEYLDGLNEAQTENEFLDEALGILGHAFVKQTRTRDGSRPDYALFGDVGAKDEALRVQGDPTKLYASSLAVAEGKYWGRNLDVYTKRDDKDNEATASQKSSPEMQIARYLQETGLSWGILTNGSEWRLYHGGAPGMTKRYYSVDLARALESEDLEDFRRFYLFFRRDAFVPKGAEGKSFLDRVHTGSEEYAVRVGKEIKDLIFTEVFPDLARGFLEYRKDELKLTVDDEALRLVYRGSLALLYRLLFLLYAEARDLLPAGDIYGYGARSMNKIRDEVAQRTDTPHEYTNSEHTLWYRLENLFRIVDDGNPVLKVPPYNGGLFKDEGSHALLKDNKLSDKYLARVIHALSRRRDEDTGEYRNVDYGFIGVRELGSVYEGLLEFSLRIAGEDLVVVKEKKKEVYVPKGSQKKKKVLGSVKAGDPYLVNDKKERKATGSYYTPRYIVNYIVENTLEPLVAERREELEARLAEIAKLKSDLRRMGKNEEYIAREARNMQPLQTLLDVKVLDPAVGSGHFLVAAVDYLTDKFSRIIAELDAEPVVEELAKLRKKIEANLKACGASATDEQLSDANLLKRMVLKRCVYGVDQNEMAVELAKLSLWLDAFTVGAPLSFLDHHLKHGHSLIGSSVREVRRELEGSGSLGGTVFEGLLSGASFMHELEENPDATIAQVEESVNLHAMADNALDPLKKVMDVWTSKHFDNAFAETVLRDELSTANFSELKRGDLASFSDRGRKVFETAAESRRAKNFFHWELEFPEVFSAGARERENAGFDAVIGNPPYGDILEQADKSFLLETRGVRTGGRAEVYAHFIARSLVILTAGGHISFIVPNTSVDGAQFGAFRQHLSGEATIGHIRDFRSKKVFEDADVLTMVLRLRNLRSRFAYETTYEYWDTVMDGFKKSKLEIAPDAPLAWQASNELTKRIEEHAMYALLDPDIGSCRDAGVDYKWKNVGWQNRGKRQPLSKVLFYSGYKKSPDDYPLIKGANLNRYHLRHDGDYLIRDFDKYRTEESAVLVYLDLALVPAKILTRQTADHIRAAVDLNQFVTAKSVHTTIVTANDYSEWYLLALLNSKLLSYIYQLRTGEQGRTFAQVKVHDLRRMPIRRISFTMASEERRRLFTEAKELCTRDLALRNDSEFINFVGNSLLSYDEGLDHRQQRSDIVHDLLSHLAKELTTVHEQRSNIELAWREWVAAVIPQQNKLKKDFYEREWVVAGLKDGWPSILAEFQARKAIPSGKALQDLKRETEEALEELRPLYERIQKTDELIDQIVYRLYGLTEEEISVVEESVKRG